jgi:hypothetical protein
MAAITNVFKCWVAAILVWHIGLSSAQSLSVGDVFVGQFEYDQGSGGEFEIRLHSAQRGALTISQYGIGPTSGQMTQCDPSTGMNCAGGPLDNPIFGYLNVSGVGSCTSPGCSPQIQPSTGCNAFGCQIPSCGCTQETQQGCWGVDLRGAVALIQVIEIGFSHDRSAKSRPKSISD